MDYLGRPGLRGQWCNSVFLVDGLGDDMGLLYDDFSMALARPHPSPHWYTRLLAARDTIHSHWGRTPRGHYRTTTAILIAPSNVLSVLDLRFLSIGSGNSRKRTLKLTAALGYEWKSFITRPAVELRSD